VPRDEFDDFDDFDEDMRTYYPLDKNQKNDLYRIIVAAGLDPQAFELEEKVDQKDNSERYSIIEHRPTSSVFLVTRKGTDASYTIRHSLGPTGVGSAVRSVDVIPYFRVWISGVIELAAQRAERTRQSQEYASIPDLWTLGSLPGAELGSPMPIANTPFSVMEQAELSSQMREITNYVRRTFELTAGQMAGIEDKLADLGEAGKRVGRKDWLTMLYGAAFSMIVNDLVPPDVVQHILSTAATGLAHLLGIGGPPGAIPY
jgi:hypothetical protein